MTSTDLLDEIDDLRAVSTGSSDDEVIDVIEKVADASIDYWDDLSGECGTICIIWADAAGALYGSLLGPIGGVIYGALFSTIAAIQE